MTMHISRVTIDSYKRIKGVDIDISGQGVVTIGGRNAQGKSTFIDAIWNVIGGKQRADTRPIRDGENKASATVTIKDSEDGAGLVATRTWKGNKSTLVVKPLGSNATLDDGQKLLNQLIGKFMFDPMAFANSKPADQRDTLMALTGLDFAEFDAAVDRIYNARRDTGRDRDRVKGSLESMEPPAANLPAEFVSVAELVEQIQGIRRVASEMERMEARQSEIAEQIRALQAEAEDLSTKMLQGSRWVSSQPKLGLLEEYLINAESTNQAIHAAQKYRETHEEFKNLENTYDAHTAMLDKRKADKAKALAEASLPIDGLSFDDTGVLYNGVPFQQASAAERIRVSVAMAIAYNPKLRVVCVKDATLMDAENLATLKQVAEENDIQLFLELVGTEGEHTLVIEDGEIV